AIVAVALTILVALGYGIVGLVLDALLVVASVSCGRRTWGTESGRIVGCPVLGRRSGFGTIDSLIAAVVVVPAVACFVAPRVAPVRIVARGCILVDHRRDPLALAREIEKDRREDVDGDRQED